ncbi:hypothetical protein PSECIP111951_00207 [Pseudoalteromonas holothuriae]|uniref:Uncharacterized protein n=1 Tax=Pseudoalteromonas holothuriae TaxID=2963714 RepID=A0ABM9GEB7_9GAMM|nr:hypothetical protein [Pseudoalteromonas sp. CIP111951]CAH9050512.1 hypothetical protein PSECIP111951_00207 [Pseudoalteromonas sp. CIP111951]
MLYEINIFDFAWVLLVANLSVFYFIARYIFNNELLNKRSKLKFIIPFGVIFSGMPVYMFFSHIYVNISYDLGNYSSVNGKILNIAEDGRYLILRGKGFRLRYSTVSGRCLTEKPKTNEHEDVKINYVFEKNDACILSIKELNKN